MRASESRASIEPWQDRIHGSHSPWKLAKIVLAKIAP